MVAAERGVLLPALSLQRAAWEYALRELDQLGWYLLDDENGDAEIAGHSADGRLVACIYGDDSIIDESGLEEIQTALVALRSATDIPPDS